MYYEIKGKVIESSTGAGVAGVPPPWGSSW